MQLKKRVLLLNHGLINDLLPMDFAGEFVGISAPTIERKAVLITQESDLAPPLPVPDLALVL